MSNTKTEYVYDTKIYRRFKLMFNNDTKEVISINKVNYKNKLYFYENYEILDPKNKDVIWISDDNYVVELTDGVVDMSKHLEFFDTLRKLKTYDKITSYINYIIL